MNTVAKLIPLMEVLDELNDGDYVWMDWENIPKKQRLFTTDDSSGMAPDNFNLDMYKFSNTKPKRIQHISKRGFDYRYGKFISMTVEGLDGEWMYENKNHLHWMYVLRDYCEV